MRNILLLTFAGALLMGVNLYSNQWTLESHLFVEHSVEIPGTVLEPGTYVFKRVDVIGHRKVIEVWNRDQTQLLARFTAIDDHRMIPEDGSEFVYHPTTTGPPPIRSWYYPGDRAGMEFVYPKKRASEIAKETGERVIGSDSSDGEVVAVSASGKEVWLMDGEARLKPSAPPAPAPTTNDAPTEPDAGTTAPSELPPTSSHQMLFLLAGSLSLGGKACVRSKKSF